MANGKDGGKAGQSNKDSSFRGLALALVMAGTIACSAVAYAYSSDRAAASPAPADPVTIEKIVEKPVYVEKIRYINRTVEVEKPVYVDRRVEVEKPVYVDRIVEVEKEVPV